MKDVASIKTSHRPIVYTALASECSEQGQLEEYHCGCHDDQ